MSLCPDSARWTSRTVTSPWAHTTSMMSASRGPSTSASGCLLLGVNAPPASGRVGSTGKTRFYSVRAYGLRTLWTRSPARPRTSPNKRVLPAEALGVEVKPLGRAHADPFVKRRGSGLVGAVDPELHALTPAPL